MKTGQVSEVKSLKRVKDNKGEYSEAQPVQDYVNLDNSCERMSLGSLLRQGKLKKSKIELEKERLLQKIKQEKTGISFPGGKMEEESLPGKNLIEASIQPAESQLRQDPNNCSVLGEPINLPREG